LPAEAKRVCHCLLSVVLASVLWLLAPHAASAQEAWGVIAGDASMNLPIKAPYAKSGTGFGVRVGSRFGLPSGFETLELGLDYTSFGADDAIAGAPATSGLSTFRGTFGARIGFDGVVRPGLFAHFGAGHVKGEARTTDAGAGPPSLEVLTHTAATWDGGVYLDLALASFFELGIQAQYVQILKSTTARSFQWLSLGAHLAIVL
jgi:hypothetical protein